MKTQPEAVKMASCHRKVKLDAFDEEPEAMSSGLSDYQGAGAMDPYMAVAIAGSRHYGVRTMSSTSTRETIRFNQPAYGSTGLNVSLAWWVENTSTDVEPEIDLDLKLLQSNIQIKSSTKSKSSTEMVYVTPSSTSTDYTVRIDRYSAAGTPVRSPMPFRSTIPAISTPVSPRGYFTSKTRQAAYI